MNKIFLILSFLAMGSAQAILSPGQTIVTVTNNSSKPIAKLRFKVQISPSPLAKNNSNFGKGSVSIENLLPGQTKTVDVKAATKKKRESQIDDQKGKIIGNEPVLAKDAILTSIEIVKIAGKNAEDQTMVRSKIIKRKKGIHNTEFSTADRFIITETDGKLTITPVK